MRPVRLIPVSIAAALLASVATLAPGVAQSQSASDFTDWTSVSGSPAVASGTLQGTSVSLSGTNVSTSPSSTLDGSSTVFNRAEFTPPLPTSDAIQFIGASGNSYTLQFGSAVTDPVLHLGSLASTLEFPTGTQITRLSGDAEFSVSGTTVQGGLDGADDANGSVRLTGSFTSVTFTTTFAGSDGIYLQVGAPAPPAPPPPPPPEEPPPEPEGNVVPPRIIVRSSAGGTVTYGCDPGQWQRRQLGRRGDFVFTWYRAGASFSDPYGGGIIFPDQEVAKGPSYVVPESLRGEKFFCKVEAELRSGAPGSAISPTVVLTGTRGDALVLTARPFGDFRIRGIDVFQITQPNADAQMFGYPSGRVPVMCGGGTPTSFVPAIFTPDCVSDDAQRADYAGVPLDWRKTAIARIYVDMAGVYSADTNQPVDVTLSPLVDGQPMRGPNGKPITRQMNDLRISRDPYVLASERANTDYSVAVSVPSSWIATAALTGPRLSLVATASLPVGSSWRECAITRGGFGSPCLANDRFRLDGVNASPFREFPDLTIRSLPLTDTNQTANTFAAPERVLQMAIRLFPGSYNLTILPYEAPLPISGQTGFTRADDECKPYITDERTDAEETRFCRAGLIDAEVDEWWRDNVGSREFNILMAVHRYDQGDGNEEPGWTRGSVAAGDRPTMSVNDGNAGRPVTAAAHEFGHALGLVHADFDFTFADGKTSGCGGNAKGQVGESWPPDHRGRLQGVAYRRVYSRLGISQGTPLVDGIGGEQYDLMSYCASEANAWLSPRNWNHTLVNLRDIFRRFTSSSARVAAAHSAQAGQAAQAYAIGVVGSGGAKILRVVPVGRGDVAPESDASSPLRLRTLGTSGAVTSEAGATVERLRVHGAADLATFTAPVGAGAAAVELVAGDAVLDTRRRTQPPTVRLRAPRRRIRVRRRGVLPVRWSSSDPDGDKLRAKLEYTPDGRRWYTVYQGPDTGRAAIRGSFLEGSSRARVRVLISDGFNETGAQSRRFRADGTPPKANIVLPAEKRGLQAGGTLLLGTASDERGRRLRGKRLTWFAGRKRLGSGEQLRASLPPGRVMLRLRARDSRGRTAVSSRKIVLSPVVLRLRTLAAPARVGPRARRMTVRVAATTPATLRAGGRRYRVGTRARALRIRLPARPRHGVLRVKLVVTGRHGQRPVRATLVVFRR